jgi:hypothetical protein
VAVAEEVLLIKQVVLAAQVEVLLQFIQALVLELQDKVLMVVHQIPQLLEIVWVAVALAVEVQIKFPTQLEKYMVYQMVELEYLTLEILMQAVAVEYLQLLEILL